MSPGSEVGHSFFEKMLFQVDAVCFVHNSSGDRVQKARTGSIFTDVNRSRQDAQFGSFPQCVCGDYEYDNDNDDHYDDDEDDDDDDEDDDDDDDNDDDDFTSEGMDKKYAQQRRLDYFAK
ncbi:hypothetical protein ElyMa_007007800 [Elysia marginata]|uniref:Uncharacterized protein n=1 Tax=Elysia marginata TaxID=1093978 RepID=A0AAV4JPJ3_9GAST|nr:hypothetical protein ElyMa_007007800 [Elysia marginata]